MTANAIGPAAALVGVLPIVQPQGLWTGRRQIVVRFAGEAETAVMYSAAALAEEMRRLAARATFHSVCLSGRDPLGNVECLEAALSQAQLALPVLVESDGQRPEAEASVTVKVLGTSFRPLIFSTATDTLGVGVVRALLPRFTSGRAAIIIRAAAGEDFAEMRRIIHQ